MKILLQPIKIVRTSSHAAHKQKIKTQLNPDQQQHTNPINRNATPIRERVRLRATSAEHAYENQNRTEAHDYVGKIRES